jgi:hypothetical protein
MNAVNPYLVFSFGDNFSISTGGGDKEEVTRLFNCFQ